MNGLIWNRMAQEYEVWLDNELITWASDEIAGQRIYNEALHQRCTHLCQEQNAWELHTLTTPCNEVIKALDKAYNDTEPFKVENGKVGNRAKN